MYETFNEKTASINDCIMSKLVSTLNELDVIIMVANSNSDRMIESKFFMDFQNSLYDVKLRLNQLLSEVSKEEIENIPIQYIDLFQDFKDKKF